MNTREDLERLSRDMADRGKLIEAGWIGLRLAAIPLDAPEIQVTEMRRAFFAGAYHLFRSIMAVLDPGEEPTEADLRRMDMIASEIDEFEAALLKDLPTGGRG